MEGNLAPNDVQLHLLDQGRTERQMQPKSHPRKPRSRAKGGPAFVFVDTTECVVRGPHNEDARVLIRRQAARSGRKHQRTQTVDRDQNDTHGGSGALVVSGVALKRVVPAEDDGSVDHSIAPQPSLTGYEALRAKFNFDITYLASFTHVDLGKTAALPLQKEPTLLSSLLRQRSSSFLSFLPSRYGSSQCLDDAMHCLAAQAGNLFGYTTRTSTISALYGKALRSLQHAITDTNLCKEADVYCATRLLTLYEVYSVFIPFGSWL